MWRYGFDTPPNYDDMSNYCGGLVRQWGKNKGDLIKMKVI